MKFCKDLYIDSDKMTFFWYIVRIFVNATMYPHPAQQEK
jgi:hypothetical protein